MRIYVVTQIGQRSIFQHLVHVYLNIPFVHIIPFITLIIINTLIIRRLIQYHRNHSRLLTKSTRKWKSIRSNSSYSRRHYRTTIMLIAVVVFFLVCRCPMLFIQLFEVKYSSEEDYDVHDHLYFRCRIQRTLGTWAKFLQTVNANGNVIIYLFFCQNFRKISKNLIRHLLSDRQYNSAALILYSMPQRSRVNTHSTNM